MKRLRALYWNFDWTTTRALVVVLGGGFPNQAIASGRVQFRHLHENSESVSTSLRTALGSEQSVIRCLWFGIVELMTPGSTSLDLLRHEPPGLHCVFGEVIVDRFAAALKKNQKTLQTGALVGSLSG